MWALAFQVSVLGSLSNIVVMSLIKGMKPDPPFCRAALYGSGRREAKRTETSI
jgi:hypothetical protein